MPRRRTHEDEEKGELEFQPAVPRGRKKKLSNDVPNFYEKVPKELIPKLPNPQFENHRLTLPFRMIIVGPSGSGKTQIFCDLLRRTSGTFNKVVFVVKSMGEPLYQTILSSTPPECIEVFEDEKLPNINDYRDYAMTQDQIIMVFDDLVSLPKPKQKPIVDVFIRGRKENVSSVYITQDYFKIPKSARLQANYLILTKTNSEGDLKMILREFSMGKTTQELMHLYHSVLREPRNFLMIDLDRMEFRRNWLEMLPTFRY